MGKEVFGTSGNSFSYTEDGAHAEYCIAPEEGVASKPACLSFLQAASLGVPWTTANIALRRGGAKPEETVLVLGGTGAVGGAAMALAKAKGCKVLGAARGPNLDVNLKDDPKLEKSLALTDGKGPDVVIDTVGFPELTLAALDVLAIRGRYSFITAGHSPDGNLTFSLKQTYRKEQSIVGSNSVNYSMAEMAQDLREISTGFGDGTLKAPKDDAFTRIDLKEAVQVYDGTKKASGAKFVVLFP